MSENQAVRELRGLFEHLNDERESKFTPLWNDDIKDIRQKCEAVIAELEAAKKRLVWFDSCKFEDHPDIQEAVIKKLGLVHGEGYQLCRNQLEAVTKERDSIESQLHEQFKGVLSIRCMKHINVPQQNKNEHSGGECGGCIAEELESAKRNYDTELGARRATQQLACHLENERNDLKRELEAVTKERDALRMAILRHKEFVDAVNPNPCKGDSDLHATLKTCQTDLKEKGTK